MSASVVQVSFFEAFCVQCVRGSEPYSSEDSALEWAANHNAENHETDNSTDDDYQRFKESRHG